jgi:hypothetical protein
VPRNKEKRERENGRRTESLPRRALIFSMTPEDSKRALACGMRASALRTLSLAFFTLLAT